jgi:hypothetical protein
MKEKTQTTTQHVKKDHETNRERKIPLSNPPPPPDASQRLREGNHQVSSTISALKTQDRM